MTPDMTMQTTRNDRAATPDHGAVLLVGNFVPVTSSYGSVSQELAERLERTGWRVLRTTYRSQKIRKALDMVWTSWSQRNFYDVAHVEVYSGRAFMWAEAVCELFRWLGKPYVIGLHGGDLPNFLRKYPRRGLRLLKPAFAVVSPSPYLQEALSFWRSDVELLPNALELQAYPGRLRRQVRPKLIWLRAFRKMYAPEVAVEGFATIARDFPDGSLTMIGPDRHDGSLDRAVATARRLGVAERVSFITGVPKREVAARLNEADIFLNTSTIDNTPVSVMEALACGLCVVSTGVGGIRYLLKDDCDSLLVGSHDSAALGAAIRRILVEDGLAAKLSSNALEKARSFDWSVVAPRWHRLLLAARTSRKMPQHGYPFHASLD